MRRAAVVDHGMGNLHSVAKALEAAGASVAVTSDPVTIDSCDLMCVPGQGIFGRCAARLTGTPLGDVVRGWIEGARPYLGICLGMQVLFERSEESPDPGLGILPGEVVRLDGRVRIPHIGWNEVNSEHYYFDHSYAVAPRDEAIVTGWCDHGGRFAAQISVGSIDAVQFHPEKSGRAGLELLQGWVTEGTLRSRVGA